MSSEARISIINIHNSDGIDHTIDASSAMESGRLKFVAKYGLDPVNIRLPNHIVGQALYFIEKHAEIKNTDDADEKLKDFYSEFVNQNHNQSSLIGLLDAAYFLRIKSLWDLMSKVVADMITGKTSEEIGKIFKLENDITSKEMRSRKDEVWDFK